MSIPIEPDPERPVERCCFCRATATHWTVLPDRKPGGQVGICEPCAETRDPADVPTKDEWFDREHEIATGRRWHSR